MASFNRIIMIGNLTRDPEYKLTAGQPVCKLGLASNRQFKNKQSGQLTQEVCFIDVDVWGNQAESCRQYLQKGRPVLVEGRLKFDSWESEGQKRSRHVIVAERVVFLGSNQQTEAGQDDSYQAQDSSQSSSSSFMASGKFQSQKNDSYSENGLASNALFKDQAPFEEDLPF